MPPLAADASPGEGAEVVAAIESETIDLLGWAADRHRRLAKYLTEIENDPARLHLVKGIVQSLMQRRKLLGYKALQSYYSSLNVEQNSLRVRVSRIVLFRYS